MIVYEGVSHAATFFCALKYIMRDDHLVFRSDSPPQFLKFWRIGNASLNGKFENHNCGPVVNNDTKHECCNELTFYEWLQERQCTDDYLTKHLPRVYEVKRHSEKLPEEEFIRESRDKDNAVKERYATPQYAFVRMQYLQPGGVTLYELCKQSKTIEEMATHTRECFQQVYQTLYLLYHGDPGKSTTKWHHCDLHTDQYVRFDDRWYLIDFERIERPSAEWPWESWQDLAASQFADYLENDLIDVTTENLVTDEQIDKLRDKQGDLWDLLGSK